MSGEPDTIDIGWFASLPDESLPAVGTWLLFIMTVLCGVTLIEPVISAGLQFHGDPTSLNNLWTFVAAFVAGLVVFFLLQRHDQGRRVFQIGFGVYLALLFGKLITVWTNLALTGATAIGAMIPVILFLHPEWYTLDLVGVLWGAIVIAMLGVSFAPEIAAILLVAWAMYDAYAVYYSDGMEELVTAGVDMSLPTVFYVPTKLNVTIQSGNPLDDDSDEFRLLGVGDALVPGMLVVSATEFLSTESVLWVLNGPAVGALAGTVVGLILLELLLRRIDRMHAGLPILTAATLCGYAAGAVATGVGITGAFDV